VEIISKLNLDAEANLTVQFGKEITFTGGGMEVKLAAIFLSKFREIIMALPDIEKKTVVGGGIKLRQPLIIDESKISAFAPLSNKALFKLRVKKIE
jgi:hypothetical protein